VIADELGPVGPIRDGAAVILFNFRGDRALELTRAFEEDDAFTRFDRGAAAGRAVRRDDAVRRRPRAAAQLSGGPAGDRGHDGRAAGRAARRSWRSARPTSSAT
jgi:hypothetical protein